jgi:hypothetical protein
MLSLKKHILGKLTKKHRKNNIFSQLLKAEVINVWKLSVEENRLKQSLAIRFPQKIEIQYNTN